MFRLGTAEALIYLLPIAAGIIGGRYLTRFPNFFLMVGVLYVDSVAMLAWGTGEFRPLGFLPALLLFPSGLLPMLVFALVASKFSKRSARSGA